MDGRPNRSDGAAFSNPAYSVNAGLKSLMHDDIR